jgi:hypothetical protein
MMSYPIAKEARKTDGVFDAKGASHDSIGRLKDNPLSIVTLGASKLSCQLKMLHGTVKNRNPTLGELLFDPGRVDAISILRSTKLRKDVDLSTLDTLGRDAPHPEPIDAAWGPLGRQWLCLKRTPVDHVVDVDGGVDLRPVKEFFLELGDLLIVQVGSRDLKVRQDRDDRFALFLVKEKERARGSAAPESRERAVREVTHVLGGHPWQDTVTESNQAELTEMNSDEAKDVVHDAFAFFGS